MSNEILHLDTRVTEDFINGKASSNGATRSTATHLFLNDLLIAYRDSDGQVYAVKKGMNAEAKAILKNLERREGYGCKNPLKDSKEDFLLP